MTGARDRRRSSVVRGLVAAILAIALGAGAMYSATHVIAPRLFTHYEYASELAPLPKRTTDVRGRTADPVNVAMVGTAAELRTAMRLAGWVVADSLTRASKIAIARSVLFNRPDSSAPVSPLFLLGRQQDIAFERDVGNSARKRHHARFWLVRGILHDGRPVWIGDATFDVRAGISHRGFHPTHHIAPNIDQERDTLLADLTHAGQVAVQFEATGMGPRVDAHNAEGDRFDTDGEIKIGVVSVGNAPVAAPRVLSPPTAVALKDRFWSWITSAGTPARPTPAQRRR